MGSYFKTQEASTLTNFCRTTTGFHVLLIFRSTRFFSFFIKWLARCTTFLMLIGYNGNQPVAFGMSRIGFGIEADVLASQMPVGDCGSIVGHKVLVFFYRTCPRAEGAGIIALPNGINDPFLTGQAFRFYGLGSTPSWNWQKTGRT